MGPEVDPSSSNTGISDVFDNAYDKGLLPAQNPLYYMQGTSLHAATQDADDFVTGHSNQTRRGDANMAKWILTTVAVHRHVF